MKKFKGLYVITDESLISRDTYFEVIDSVLSCRPEFIQFRAKNLDKKESLIKAKEIRSISLKHGVKFIVNDSLDIAINSDADGIHIGKTDDSFSSVRKEIGNHKIIGVSCYGDLDRCRKYADLGADYIAIGTPYFTKTKPDRKKTTLNKMKEIVDKIESTPIFAIGGIDNSNLLEIMKVGVDGVAVINSVFAANNPKEATLALVDIINKGV